MGRQQGKTQQFSKQIDAPKSCLAPHASRVHEAVIARPNATFFAHTNRDARASEL